MRIIKSTVQRFSERAERRDQDKRRDRDKDSSKIPLGLTSPTLEPKPKKAAPVAAFFVLGPRGGYSLANNILAVCEIPRKSRSFREAQDRARQHVGLGTQQCQYLTQNPVTFLIKVKNKANY